MIRVGRQGSGDVDEVGHDRAGGRLGTSAFAIKHCMTDCIAMDPDSIHCALDTGE